MAQLGATARIAEAILISTYQMLARLNATYRDRVHSDSGGSTRLQRPPLSFPAPAFPTAPPSPKAARRFGPPQPGRRAITATSER